MVYLHFLYEFDRLLTLSLQALQLGVAALRERF